MSLAIVQAFKEVNSLAAFFFPTIILQYLCIFFPTIILLYLWIFSEYVWSFSSFYSDISLGHDFHLVCGCGLCHLPPILALLSVQESVPCFLGMSSKAYSDWERSWRNFDWVQERRSNCWSNEVAWIDTVCGGGGGRKRRRQPWQQQQQPRVCDLPGWLWQGGMVASAA